MAPTIFITGVSGYIGGQLLHDITKAHPEYQIRALVRTTPQLQKIATAYPSIHLVLGDLDSAEILKAEAARADVVFQLADADHLPSLTPLITSLPPTSTFIQLSGAASISSTLHGPGTLDPRKWSDIVDLSEITTFPHSHLHAVTDQAVLSLGLQRGVRTAVVIPPVVYGTGEGEGRTQSMVVPWYVDAVRKRGGGFVVGKGSNVASGVHVRDLGRALVFLVEEALKEGGGRAEWGERGWYYVDGGEYVFRELAEKLVKAMVEKGAIEKEGLDEIDIAQAKELHPYAELLWGVNMRVNGERIRRLGWRAKEADVFSTISELL
ncbi:NAD(P)-binding protein [Hyaloscypha variabilis]